MPPVRAHRPPSPALQAWLAAQRGLAGLAETLRTPRRDADELDEARELLAYWEARARGLPRWALLRRREARDMARRWRDRVRAAERERYGRGLLGAASQLTLEHRMPTTVAHRGRQALRLAAYTAVTVFLTMVLVVIAAVALVAEAVLGAL